MWLSDPLTADPQVATSECRNLALISGLPSQRPLIPQGTQA